MINKVYKQEALFTDFYLQAYINSHNHIIDNLNLNLVDDIFLLRNNIVDLLEIKKQNLSKQNRAFISIVSLALLYYGQNKCSNMFQGIISYYVFFGNILKQSVEYFY